MDQLMFGMEQLVASGDEYDDILIDIDDARSLLKEMQALQFRLAELRDRQMCLGLCRTTAVRA